MKRLARSLGIAVLGTVGLALVLLLVVAPLATAPRGELAPLAREWHDRGGYFRWTSTLASNADFEELDIFHIEAGNPDNPAILFIHGYPTSSFDFYDLFELLVEEYYLLALDTPGYGLSDKPRDGYEYSIQDDARLVDYYLRNIAGVESFALYTHDKGNSVGLAFLDLYSRQDQYEMTHHFITNGNIYLPLAKLTRIQLILLDRFWGPLATRYVNGNLFARNMNEIAHSTPEAPEKVDAVASIIDFQDGGEVQHATIQYLAQRKENEVSWLENLRESRVPVTLIWGVDDTVAPLAVADFVWKEYLQSRSADSFYQRIENSNHYLQNDAPGVIAELIAQTLSGAVR
jgi:pimeloyl-ACP methyl ester carboxylesterase